MSDWRDIMNARSAAEDAVRDCDRYGGVIEDGRTSDPALATLLAARAVCAELRALGMVIDYASTNGGPQS